MSRPQDVRIDHLTVPIAPQPGSPPAVPRDVLLPALVDRLASLAPLPDAAAEVVSRCIGHHVMVALARSRRPQP